MASQMSAILRAGTPLKRRIICVINPKSVYPVTNAAKALLAIAPHLDPQYSKQEIQEERE